MSNTILFGNGINRLIPANISWDTLLAEIKGDNNFENGRLPNTMIYERIVMDGVEAGLHVYANEDKTKKRIAELMMTVGNSEIYTRLFELDVEHFMTTNYDYAFLHSLEAVDSSLRYRNHATEEVYSIRRKKTIDDGHKTFWQIHGEISKHKSIMLGLDHYCGAVSRINSYIRGGYVYSQAKSKIKEPSIVDKVINKGYTNSSWIELFFNSDIHIIGLGLDYSEIDLWWLLNKRARLMKGDLKNKIENNITFYCDNISEEKGGLLKSLNVQVRQIPLSGASDQYTQLYHQIIEQIEMSCSIRNERYVMLE